MVDEIESQLMEIQYNSLKASVMAVDRAKREMKHFHLWSTDTTDEIDQAVKLLEDVLSDMLGAFSTASSKQ